MSSWAENTGNKLLNSLFDKLDVYGEKRSDEDMKELLAHVVTALTHRMVLDSLSVRQEEVTDGVPSKELMIKVGKKFHDVRVTLEQSIATAFEIGVSEAANRESMFTCKITSVSTPKNALPC